MGALWHSTSSKLAVPDTAVEDAPSPAPRHRGRRYGWMALGVLLLIALVVLGFAIEKEVRTSRLQAQAFSRFAAALNYSMHAGASDSMLYPGAGPFDKRLGYSSLGDFLPRLLKRDYVIAARLDGASGLRLVRYITVPLVRPTLVVVLTTIMIGSLKVFDIVRTMTGGQFGTQVIANTMYDQAFRYSQPGRGSAIAVLLLVLVIPLIVYNVRQMRRNKEVRG